MSKRVLLLGTILFMNCTVCANLRVEDASPKGAALALRSTRLRLSLIASSFWQTLTSIDSNGWARRVLLLPFLEAEATYKAYRFDEPWNGPHNIKLLDKMPTVYSDPINGQNHEHYTHYVAIAGDGMAFSEKGGTLGEDKDDPKKPSGGRRIADFRDGSSRTLLVGSVGPNEKIPWLKPQDIEVTEALPRLGKPGSFAAPYNVEGIGRVGGFAAADGVAWMIGEKIDKDDFRALLTIADGEYVNPERVTGVVHSRPVRQVPVIYVDEAAGTPKATVVQEAVGFGF